jgi:hypothetical protein
MQDDRTRDPSSKRSSRGSGKASAAASRQARSGEEAPSDPRAASVDAEDEQLLEESLDVLGGAAMEEGRDEEEEPKRRSSEDADDYSEFESIIARTKGNEKECFQLIWEVLKKRGWSISGYRFGDLDRDEVFIRPGHHDESSGDGGKKGHPSKHKGSGRRPPPGEQGKDFFKGQREVIKYVQARISEVRCGPGEVPVTFGPSFSSPSPTGPIPARTRVGRAKSTGRGSAEVTHHPSRDKKRTLDLSGEFSDWWPQLETDGWSRVEQRIGRGRSVVFVPPQGSAKGELNKDYFETEDAVESFLLHSDDYQTAVTPDKSGKEKRRRADRDSEAAAATGAAAAGASRKKQRGASAGRKGRASASSSSRRGESMDVDDDREEMGASDDEGVPMDEAQERDGEDGETMEVGSGRLVKLPNKKGTWLRYVEPAKPIMQGGEGRAVATDYSTRRPGEFSTKDPVTEIWKVLVACHGYKCITSMKNYPEFRTYTSVILVPGAEKESPNDSYARDVDFFEDQKACVEWVVGCIKTKKHFRSTFEGEYGLSAAGATMDAGPAAATVSAPMDVADDDEGRGEPEEMDQTNHEEESKAKKHPQDWILRSPVKPDVERQSFKENDYSKRQPYEFSMDDPDWVIMSVLRAHHGYELHYNHKDFPMAHSVILAPNATKPYVNNQDYFVEQKLCINYIRECVKNGTSFRTTLTPEQAEELFGCDGEEEEEQGADQDEPSHAGGNDEQTPEADGKKRNSRGSGHGRGKGKGKGKARAPAKEAIAVGAASSGGGKKSSGGSHAAASVAEPTLKNADDLVGCKTTSEELCEWLLKFHDWRKMDGMYVRAGCSLSGRKDVDWFASEDDVDEWLMQQWKKVPEGHDKRMAQRLIVGPNSVARRDLIGGDGPARVPEPSWVTGEETFMELGRKLVKYHKFKWSTHADRTGLGEAFKLLPPESKGVKEGVKGKDYFESDDLEPLQDWCNKHLFDDPDADSDLEPILGSTQEDYLEWADEDGLEHGEEEEEEDDEERMEGDEEEEEEEAAVVDDGMEACGDLTPQDDDDDNAGSPGAGASGSDGGRANIARGAASSGDGDDSCEDQQTSSSTRAEPKEEDEYKDEYFNPQWLLDNWDEDFLLVRQVLEKSHGWRLIDHDLKFIKPGRQNVKPKELMVQRDYLLSLDEVREYITQGYGLRPRKDAPDEDIPDREVRRTPELGARLAAH